MKPEDKTKKNAEDFLSKAAHEGGMPLSYYTEYLKRLPEHLALVRVGFSAYALVDAADLPLVRKFPWYLHKSRRLRYAKTCLPDKTYLCMHQLIVESAPGLDIDHINSNGLDNRRKNLRVVTRAQHHHNRRKLDSRPVTSRFKGVCLPPSDTSKWRADIIVYGKGCYLGRFAREVDAAHAYDTAALLFFDQYAKINFPNLREKKEMAIIEIKSGFNRLISQSKAVTRPDVEKMLIGLEWNDRMALLGYFKTTDRRLCGAVLKYIRKARRNSVMSFTEKTAGAQASG